MLEFAHALAIIVGIIPGIITIIAVWFALRVMNAPKYYFWIFAACTILGPILQRFIGGYLVYFMPRRFDETYLTLLFVIPMVFLFLGPLALLYFTWNLWRQRDVNAPR